MSILGGSVWANDPGITGAYETYEASFQWGRTQAGVIVGGHFDGAARDAGNSPTTVLRPGLLLGKVASSGLLKEYLASATDGSQVVFGVLITGLRMVDPDGNNVKKFYGVLVGGPVRAAALIGLDNNARKQMRHRFILDDDVANKFGYGDAMLNEVAKTANYTVVAADAGTLFTTTGAAGAVTFTLPALAAGLGPFEFLNTVDQNMAVASAAGDDIMTFNDAAADSLTFSTAGQKIGARLRFWANAAGTKWYVENLSPGAYTITVAT